MRGAALSARGVRTSSFGHHFSARAFVHSMEEPSQRKYVYFPSISQHRYTISPITSVPEPDMCQPGSAAGLGGRVGSTICERAFCVAGGKTTFPGPTFWTTFSGESGPPARVPAHRLGATCRLACGPGPPQASGRGEKKSSKGREEAGAEAVRPPDLAERPRPLTASNCTSNCVSCRVVTAGEGALG